MVNFLMLGKICLYWCKFEMFTFIQHYQRSLDGFPLCKRKIYTLKLLPWIPCNHCWQFLHDGLALSQGYRKRDPPYRSFIILPELCSLNSDKNEKQYYVIFIKPVFIIIFISICIKWVIWNVFKKK